MNNGDMPANPIIGDTEGFIDFLQKIKGGRNYGLTKREQFAMAAMQGLIGLTSVSSEVLAKASIDAADALLKELSNETTN